MTQLVYIDNHHHFSEASNRIKASPSSVILRAIIIVVDKTSAVRNSCDSAIVNYYDCGISSIYHASTCHTS